MIASDQPTIFPSPFFVATSSIENGVIRHPGLDPDAAGNIVTWCSKLGVPLERTVGLYITYADTRSYTEIIDVSAPADAGGASTEKGWIKADALITNTPDIALLLPVADCNAVVYADPVNNVVALLHLGWHSTVHNLATKAVQYMIEHYGSSPADILIYNSPSIRARSYRFTHLSVTANTRWHQSPYAVKQLDGTYAIDLVQYNYDQWIEVGIAPEHIELIPIDTATSDNYPSHFAGQKSRFAVLAKIAK